MNKIPLIDLFKWYRDQPHQKEAIAQLERAINQAAPTLLDRSAAWYKVWQGGQQLAKGIPGASPQVKAFLDMISVPEGTSGVNGYRTMFTGKLFESFEDHPRRLQRSGKLASDAAGKYQFLSTTWDMVAQDLGLSDFSPPNQDLAAIELMRRRGALPFVEEGNVRSACNLCSWEWASLPPGRYGQPSVSFEEAERLFQQFGGRLKR